ncbi:EVE domain-containing protein [Piscirickettsia litoralis]|uniref:EVE domain-containing protein n=1 Tax=Piscirickettsia litoralis TaxID=1891921 RepID=A0ABX3A3D0_9GAMM|nr:EVE domain-containing protein [Piscirickettsia litoralis]ODN42742.1 EVE domain-containing protein [Piscirickettsia litoralis]
MNYWLMKSEPDAFGIDDLQALPKQTDSWDGIRNYQARNMMRDEMKVDDLIFFYHSNCKVPGIVGIMKVASKPYPDHTQFDPESKYYDPKATTDKPRWMMVDVKFVEKFSKAISLNTLKQTAELSEMAVVRKGNRLSITPVTPEQWQTILSMR